jgi:hypothetical protein
MAPILFDDAALIVKPEAAAAQLAREPNSPWPSPHDGERGPPTPGQPVPSAPRRFFGSIVFRPDRLVREAAPFRRKC